MGELEFEDQFIDYLTKIGGTKQWEYRPEIKTTEQLWENFKRIIEQNNRARLSKPLSDGEFAQVKKRINDIQTPYDAGRFLYGVNGVSQVEVDLDDGRHVYLNIFDQDQVGAGNTVYQIVNQIQRPRIIDGRPDRRFDVTLLINGLPIIQVELKKSGHPVTEALNQMEQYIEEKQYTGIFSTVQILIAMTPFETRYMANTTRDNFNRAFAFHWQNEDDARHVNDWRAFSDKVLSIPMAHDMATRFMILDGTKNRECIKVMRPYQVYATQRVLEKVQKYDFRYENGRLGYVWHTTGSGKTITSFKTAWLTSRLPNVDKVIFLVDRIALTNQTFYAYKAYDPTPESEGSTGLIADTFNVSDLHQKLTKASDKNIIVTSIQKMSRYVSQKNFKGVKGNILFIVDEAHRSTGDGRTSSVSLKQMQTKDDNSQKMQMLEAIRAALPTAGWIGYTGTPKFPETREIFGNLLHAYTIKEAIADKNVLGFKVEFKETIVPPENPSEDDIDDNVKESVYDTSLEHVRLVVQDIFDNWQARSNSRRYNAMMTVHVGGGKPSTPRAMQYFDEFERQNAMRPENERLKVAVSFSADSSNGDNQNANNDGLARAMAHYNVMFGADYDLGKSGQYTDNVASRLNRTVDDHKYLDLVIVVDQLLTGFDAPQLNTLYIDRTLKGANLIQAYSRTNRIEDLEAKPAGNVVNYRWPVQNEEEMNKAFYIYSNRDSALEQDVLISDKDARKNLEDSGVLARPFNEVLEETQEVIRELRKLTQNFTQTPPSEHDQDELFTCLKQYNSLVSKLKQYTEDGDGIPISAYDNPDDFYARIGITQDQEVTLTTVIADDLKLRIADKEDVDISQVDLAMVHIHNVKIDYDYLTGLLAQMADEVHAGDTEKAEQTLGEIHREIAKSENDDEKKRFGEFAQRIFTEEYTFDSYPAPRDVDSMTQAMKKSHKNNAVKLITEFIRYWGLDNATSPSLLEQLIRKHTVGQEDLDKQGELNDMINRARQYYPDISHVDVQSMSWIKYRTNLRNATYDLADEIQGK